MITLQDNLVHHFVCVDVGVSSLGRETLQPDIP